MIKPTREGSDLCLDQYVLSDKSRPNISEDSKGFVEHPTIDPQSWTANTMRYWRKDNVGDLQPSSFTGEPLNMGHGDAWPISAPTSIVCIHNNEEVGDLMKLGAIMFCGHR